MLKCRVCGRYTLKQACPACGGQTVRPGPARYSPEDPYGAYRRRLKRMVRLAEAASLRRDSPSSTSADAPVNEEADQEEPQEGTP